MKTDIQQEFLYSFGNGIVTKDYAHEKGFPHSTVHCLVHDDKYALLQRRSESKSNFPNKLDVTVGGHVRYGEGLPQALIRESLEELDLAFNLSKLKYVGAVNEHLLPNDIETANLYTYEVPDVLAFALEVRPTDEVDGVTIVPLDYLVSGHFDLVPHAADYWNKYLDFIRSESERS